MKKLIVLLVMMVLAPSLSRAGMMSFMVADEARREAEKAREAAEATRRAIKGSFCEIREANGCPACAISCADGVAAICMSGKSREEGAGCECREVCATSPVCRCEEK